jgi:hypothetical protein
MADYITPQYVDANAFKLATSVNRYKLFGPKLKPRGDRLVAVDLALESLRDNYRPQANPAETRGLLLLVIREARNWLRNVRRKADTGNFGTVSREYKRVAVRKLVAEATDALIACTPGFADAMQAYAEQKRGGVQEFRMKGLSGVYTHEGNLYRSGGKFQGKTVSATLLHGRSANLDHDPHQNARARNRDIHRTQQDAKKRGLDGEVVRLIESMMRGEVLFENFSEVQFETLGRYVDAKVGPAKVVYLSKIERLQHIKHVRDGKLYNIDDTPFATAGGAVGTCWAMDCYGNLFAGDRHISDVQVNHSSFLAGKDVACAGLILTNAEGMVTEIDNISGHYKPTREHLHEVLSYLATQGLNFDRATVRVMGPEGERKYRASAWIRDINAPPLGNKQFTIGGSR